MITIWKYNLETTDRQVLEMPKGARILTVQLQYGEPCMWAQVDSENELESRVIRIFWTGHDADILFHRYIGTYQLLDGAMVCHVFEEGQ